MLNDVEHLNLSVLLSKNVKKISKAIFSLKLKQMTKYLNLETYLSPFSMFFFILRTFS